MKRTSIRTFAGIVALELTLTLCPVGQQASAATPEADLVSGNTAFALDLYERLSTEKGNLFFSPYSISTALAMTYAGARERTAEQMTHTLHFTLGQQQLHPAFGELQQRLNAIQEKGGVQLLIANSLFPQKGYQFLSAYTDLINKDYDASVTPVDYVEATEESRRTINRWVEKKTENKIKDLIQKGMLDANTVMVLANAIYFKGDWALQFKKDMTATAPFYLSASKSVDVPMMRQMARFKYNRRGDVQILELPYEGKSISMLVLLPEQGKLADLERSLSAKNLSYWNADLVEIQVRVLLPKFEMTRHFNLSRILSNMGMTDIFDDRADFSGMDGKKDALFISDVVHKAFVEVSEEGTEAAAATGVTMEMTGVKPPPEFNANRPFLFLIKENETGSILFMGRVTNPAVGI